MTFLIKSEVLGDLINAAIAYGKDETDREKINKLKNLMHVAQQFKIPDWATHFVKFETVWASHGEQTFIRESQKIDPKDKNGK